MDSTDPAESHNSSAQINRLQSLLSAANAKLQVGETRYEELMKENFSLETILKGYQQESVKATNLTSTLQSQLKKQSDFLLKNFGESWEGIIGIDPSSPSTSSTRSLPYSIRNSLLRKERRESFNPVANTSFQLDSIVDISSDSLPELSQFVSDGEGGGGEGERMMKEKMMNLLNGMLISLEERKKSLELLEASANKEKELADQKGREFMKLLDSQGL